MEQFTKLCIDVQSIDVFKAGLEKTYFLEFF